MSRVVIILAAVAIAIAGGVAGYLLVAPASEPAQAPEAVSPAAATTTEVAEPPAKPDFVPVKDRTLRSQIDKGSISLEKQNVKILKAPQRDLPKADETETP